MSSLRSALVVLAATSVFSLASSSSSACENSTEEELDNLEFALETAPDCFSACGANLCKAVSALIDDYFEYEDVDSVKELACLNHTAAFECAYDAAYACQPLLDQVEEYGIDLPQDSQSFSHTCEVINQSGSYHHDFRVEGSGNDDVTSDASAVNVWLLPVLLFPVSFLA